MTSPQFLSLEQSLLLPTALSCATVQPSAPDTSASYAVPVDNGTAGVPDGALRCGLCHKAWGGDVTCADCGALVYGPRSVEEAWLAEGPEAMDAVDALEEPVGEPSADAQEAVRAAVAAAVPSAKAVNRRRQTGGALHSLAEAAPTQGRLSRMGVAAGSPLATGGGHVVVPAPTATAWPSGSLGVTVPGGGFGAPVPSFMAPAAGQPMAQAYPTAGATAIPQVMGSVYPAAGGMTPPGMAGPVYPTTGGMTPPGVAGPVYPTTGGMTPPGMAGPVYPTTGGLNQPQPLGQPPAYGSYSSGPLPAVTTPFEPLKPSYSSLARLSTRPVTQPKVHHSWIMELVFACSGLVMVVVAAVVWTRIHERIQECVGGCPDLDSVIDAVQFNGWSIIGLSALAMVLAGFSLRTTRGTDAVRALGSLVLVASVATIVLGALVLATSLP